MNYPNQPRSTMESRPETMRGMTRETDTIDDASSLLHLRRRRGVDSTFRNYARLAIRITGISLADYDETGSRR